MRALLNTLTEDGGDDVARWAHDGEPFSFAVRNNSEFCTKLYGSGDAKKWGAFVRLCTDYGISRTSSSPHYPGWTIFKSDKFHKGVSADEAAMIPSRRKSRSNRATGYFS